MALFVFELKNEFCRGFDMVFAWFFGKFRFERGFSLVLPDSIKPPFFLVFLFYRKFNFLFFNYILILILIYKIR